MKRFLFTLLLLVITVSTIDAKSYKWKGLDHDLDVVCIKNSGNNTQILKVFAIGSNPDKAIDQAMQDAVAAAIFCGYQVKMDVPKEPLCSFEHVDGSQFYAAHQQYFDEFFKKGYFLDYVRNVNTRYPSGENNIAVDGGRKVGVNIEIDYGAINQRLINDGILRKVAQ